jgi:hypothetical protein
MSLVLELSDLLPINRIARLIKPKITIRLMQFNLISLEKGRAYRGLGTVGIKSQDGRDRK